MRAEMYFREDSVKNSVWTERDDKTARDGGGQIFARKKQTMKSYDSQLFDIDVSPLIGHILCAFQQEKTVI
jgi:hypothetical protein